MVVFKIAPIQFSCSRLQVTVDPRKVRDPKIIELARNFGFELNIANQYVYKRENPLPSELVEVLTFLYKLNEEGRDVSKIVDFHYEGEFQFRSSSGQLGEEPCGVDAEDVFFIPVELTDTCFRRCAFCYARTRIAEEPILEVNVSSLRDALLEILGKIYQRVKERYEEDVRRREDPSRTYAIVVGIGGGEPLTVHDGTLFDVVVMIRRELEKFSKLVRSTLRGVKVYPKITMTTSALHRLYTCTYLVDVLDGVALTYVQPVLQRYTSIVVNEYVPLLVREVAKRYKNVGVHFIVTRNVPEHVMYFLEGLLEDAVSHSEMHYIHVTPLHYIPVTMPELVPEKEELFRFLTDRLIPTVVPSCRGCDLSLLLDVCTVKRLFGLDYCSRAVRRGLFMQVRFDGKYYYVQRLRAGQCPMTETRCPIEQMR